MKLVTNTNFSD